MQKLTTISTIEFNLYNSSEREYNKLFQFVNELTTEFKATQHKIIIAKPTATRPLCQSIINFIRKYAINVIITVTHTTGDNTIYKTFF